MVYPQMAGLEYFEITRPHTRHAQGEGGYAARVGRWLKDSF
jgi:cell division protein FtsA